MGVLTSVPSRLRSLAREYTLVAVLLCICTVVSILVPRFLMPQNVINVAIQIAINALLATGMTFVILTGGIDLSVGSVAALSGILTTALLVRIPNASIVTCFVGSIFLSIVVGTICGAFSGLAIAKLNVEPFIATLAVMSVARGLAFVYTQSRPIFGLPEPFGWIGQEYIGFVPVIVLIMIVVMLAAHIILDRTPFGRYVYAVGSSEEVARLSGINVGRVKLAVYIISGVLSAFGGVCLASRLATGQPAAASGYELNAIAAVAMGGTSMSGGRGGIAKTVIGLLTIGVINNGLSLLQISSYWQSITMGLIILLAVVLDQLRNRKV